MPETAPAEPGNPATTQRQKPWSARVARWIAISLLAIVALIGAVLLGINTGPGRRLVVNYVQDIAFANGLKIGIGRISGSLYGQMAIRDLTLSDSKGVFLSAPVVLVDWRPFAYLRRHVDVRSVAVRQMTVSRQPVLIPQQSNDPLLPDLDIDIGRLTIDRLVLGPALAGARRVARVEGAAHIADRRAQVTMKAATLAGGGNTGGDRIDVMLDAVPDANRLAMRLSLDAPRGGAVAGLAGLKSSLRAQVQGRGTWRGWRGRLDADLAGSPLARLVLTANNGTFRVMGNTGVARLAPESSRALLGPITRVDATATLDQRRTRINGMISSDAFALSSEGLIDLGASEYRDLRLAFTLAKPSVLAPNLRGRSVRAAVTLNGKFATPVVAYQLNAAQLAFNDTGVDDIVATGRAVVDADHILIPVTARARRITGLDTVAGGSVANVRLDGDLAISGTQLLSDNLRIRSDRIDAKAIVVANIATGLYTGAINGRVDNYRVQSVGVFNIVTRADLKTAANAGFVMTGNVKLRSTRLFNDGVRNFLGGNAVAATDLAYGTDGAVRLTNLRVSAPQFRIVDGRGSYAPDGRITLVARATSSQYGPIGVQVAGTVAKPQAVLTAARPGLGVGLADLRATLRSDGRGYLIGARGQTDYGPFTADLTVLTAAGPLTIDIARANFAGIAVSGRVRQSAAGPFTGRLDARGQGIGGVVRLQAAGRYQGALVNLRANDAVLPGPANLAIGGAIVDARIILYDQPEIVADAQLAQTTIGGVNINAARAIVQYRAGSGTAKLLAEGTSGVPFRVAMNAQLEPRLWRATITGRASGVDFRTVNAARVIPSADSYELQPTRIDFGSGSIRLAGRYGRGLAVQSRLDALDLKLANALLPGLGMGGSATGSLDFTQDGATAFPRADARLRIDNFTRTTAVSVSRAVAINLVGQLSPGGGDVRAVMRQQGTVIGRVQATLSPLPPGSGGWYNRILQAPLGGGIRYNGPADTLFSFAAQPGQRLSGPIGVAADFTCRLAQPCLNGVVRADKLVYENVTYGTRLTDMAIAGRFTNDRFELTALRAVAGDGSVTAQGYVSLAAARGFPMDIRVKLDNARLARSEAIATTATGDLRLTKVEGEAALLSGTMRLPETRYRIIRQGAAQIPELTGVRFKPPLGRPRIAGDRMASTDPGPFGMIRLDVKLAAPEQLYVSGMGLESEWRADLAISGTSDAPQLSGQVNLVRGTLSFARRSFDLARGRIQFTGGRTIDPTVLLEGSDSIEGVTVTLNVTGRAYDPQIAFSSTPGLPQDEIVSRILFGSSVTNLSAIQTVQLAASLNSLRGGAGGLDPLGKLQSATGIDRLRILSADQATGRGTALAAGQYITKNIYIEIVTDARGFTATQLEVSLTRSLSVLSQAGGSGVTNVNVRYRKDY